MAALGTCPVTRLTRQVERTLTVYSMLDFHHATIPDSSSGPHRSCSSLLGHIALVLLFWSSSAAQETKRSANITIEVKTITGGVVARAEGELLAQGNLEEKAMVTDSAGVLLIELEPASYNVLVSSPGFEPLKRQITINTGEDQKIKVVLGFAGCPPETCIMDFVPPDLQTEHSDAQTTNVDITSIELLSRSKTGNAERQSAFREFRETQDRRITPATKFDVVCEVRGELDLTTSDFFL